MQITTTNATSFKALEYCKTPALEKVLASQKPHIKEALTNAEKELANTATKLVILERGSEFLCHYVDLGEDAISYIDCARNDGNMLEVYGYSFDKDGTALKNTSYICCEIPLKSPDVAERYAKAINANSHDDIFANIISKAVVMTKALNEII